jgi:hypothetical protein
MNHITRQQLYRLNGELLLLRDVAIQPRPKRKHASSGRAIRQPIDSEILRVASGADGDEQARRFIEQLWECDQILFDATSSH